MQDLAGGNRERASAFVRQAAALVPLAFAIPVAYGILAALFDLIRIDHPYGFWSPMTNSSAAALYSGEAIYQDPRNGFIGGIFPPVLPGATAALDHIHYWSGWSILITVAASVGLAAIAGCLAYRPLGASRRSIALGVATAAGLAGLAWWMVSTLQIDFLLDGRADQVSWALGFAGLICVPRGVTVSWRACAAATLLLIAALWTRQTATTFVAVAIGWALVTLLLGVADRRKAGTLMAGLVFGNLAIYGLLQLATAGWFSFYAVDLARNQTLQATLTQAVDELWRSLLIPGGIVTAFVLIAIVVNRRVIIDWLAAGPIRDRIRAELRSPGRGAIALILTALLVLATMGALYARRKQGATDNQFIGVIWAMGLLGAIAWRQAVLRTSGAVAAAVVLLAVVWLTGSHSAQVSLADQKIYVPDLKPTVSWGEVPPDVKRYARTHYIYDARRTDLNVWAETEKATGRKTRMYPAVTDMFDLLSTGQQPMGLVRALLGRDFDAVSLIESDNGYASGFGEHEEGYVWKLNEIIKARYAASASAPVGYLERRPGPERDSWMRHCFGPFRAAGTEFVIGHVGGFWCRSPDSSRLRLRAAPAEISELRSARPLDGVAGSIGVTTNRLKGGFEIGLGGSAYLIGTISDAGVKLTQYAGSASVGTIEVPSGPKGVDLVLQLQPGGVGAPLKLSHGAVAVHLGPAKGAILALQASRKSDLTYDLRGLNAAPR